MILDFQVTCIKEHAETLIMITAEASWAQCSEQFGLKMISLTHIHYMYLEVNSKGKV